MKTTPETHEPLQEFPQYPLDEMQSRAAAFHAEMTRRRSVRAFADTPVPREIIENCMLTAGSAPSGANHQPWFFACVGSPENKRAIREAERKAKEEAKAAAAAPS